jgi:hypothetical protein
MIFTLLFFENRFGLFGYLEEEWRLGGVVSGSAASNR